MSFLTLILASVIMNKTFSPDSSKFAFTRGNDLYVTDVAAGDTVRLTRDGNETLMNGYASWVYFEEIFGRPSKYRAFWWSPDSRKIAYYRFDDSGVSLFPIYSPKGPSESFSKGTTRNTRYPLAGERNPQVRVCITDLDKGETVVAFDGADDVYYGTPFWSADSRELFVSLIPRRQNHLDLYAVSASDGSKRNVYSEDYPTWIKWINGMVFSDKGLYMVRDFDTGWQQIYWLPFNGKGVRRLTSGENWNMNLLKLDAKRGKIWFTAMRDSRLHETLYCLNIRNGKVTALTDPSLYARNVVVKDDGTFTADCSVSGAEVVKIQNEGYDLYGLMAKPDNFDPSRRYPVIMRVYGGPGTMVVHDWRESEDTVRRWCRRNGVIYMYADPRTSGENGRRGMDEAFRRMTVVELQDYLAWAQWLQSLPYVDGGHIGVEGFSFGGTTTSMLVLRYPEYFHCGIAGGGVYDWHLYDTHYTERYMCTPHENAEGYTEASVLHYVREGLISKDYKDFHLKITHGTGDDNVHFQNTLLLIDALQQKKIMFDFMIYPDALHGYKGRQAAHSKADDIAFWKANLYD